MLLTHCVVHILLSAVEGEGRGLHCMIGASRAIAGAQRPTIASARAEGRGEAEEEGRKEGKMEGCSVKRLC